MFPVSSDVLAALNGSYELVSEVFLLRDTPVRIPVSSGAVTASYQSRVARTASLVVDREVFDFYDLSVLSDQVMIRMSVKGFPEIPIFTGRITDIDDDRETGAISLDCVDHGDDVIAAKFEAPWATSGLQTVTYDMEAILVDVDSSFVASFDPQIIDTPDPVQIFEEDRGQALDDLASAINSIWMADRSGGFTVFRNPYSFPSEPPSFLTLTDGVNGDFATASRVTSRSDTYNSVTVIVERTDGTSPIRQTVKDSVVGSPTFWGGPFGKRNLIINNATPNNSSEARRMADRLLQQRLAATREQTFTSPLLMILDPGDLVTTVIDDTVSLQVIQQITLDLDASTVGSASCREWRFIEEV